jgi:hypothetical protein
MQSERKPMSRSSFIDLVNTLLRKAGKSPPQPEPPTVVQDNTKTDVHENVEATVLGASAVLDARVASWTASTIETDQDNIFGPWGRAQTWTVPKIGTDQDHNEDSVGIQLDSSEVKLRAVISDGASSTWCSRQWAQILNERFSHSFDESPFNWHDSTTWNEGLKECKLLWEANVPKVHHKLSYLNELADEKQKVGAGACLIVLECDLATHTWRALAYGNSMLVHARSNEILLCGPLDQPDQFESYTPLVSSGASSIQNESHLWARAGDFADGDDFFLFTDELAKWTVTDSLVGRLQLLRKVDSQSSFEMLVAALREQRAVQDDDMSAIHLVLGGVDG